MTQTSPSQPQVAKQREWELQHEIFGERFSPGLKAMFELAKLKSDEVHAAYLKSGPSEKLWAEERQWFAIMKIIEQGPTIQKPIPVMETP